MGAPKIEFEQTAELLKACRLFEDVSPAAVEFVASECEYLTFTKGATIILENEAAAAVYFIVKGQVEIATYIAEEKRIQRTSLLKEGYHFGEFSIVTQTARSGSVYAFTNCELIKISGARFLQLIENNLDVALNQLGHIARLHDSFFKADDFIPFFNLGEINPTQNVAQVFPATMWKKFAAVPVLFKPGLLTFAVQNSSNQGLLENTARLFPKAEIAFQLVDSRRFEEIYDIAQTASRTTALTTKEAAVQTTNIQALLRHSDLLSRLSIEMIEQLTRENPPVSVQSGDVIFAAQQTTESLFVVLKGSVLVTRKLNTAAAHVPLLTLKPGQTIGDSQLLMESKSPCTYRAVEDSEILVLSKDVVNSLLDIPGFAIDFMRSIAKRLHALTHISGVTFPTDAEFDFSSVAKILTTAQIDESQAVPLKIANGEITLGLIHPEDSKSLLKLGRYLADYRIRIVGLTDVQFKKFRANFAIDATNKTPANENDILKWIDTVFVNALRLNASDIHFEPGASGLTVRFRVDGVLREFGDKKPAAIIPQLVNRLKIIAKMDISVSHLPQDGHLEVDSTTVKFQARMSTLPLRYGETIVLRVIRERNSIVPLDAVAPDQRIVEFFRSIANRRQGLFLVTGPTGSGKTTTLYSLLGALNQVDRKLISVEDPVEMEVSGVNQVEINQKRGMDFVATLRSVLRQDIDVLMVGEIRDAASAKIVFDAAITGHLVLSTLHAGSSFDTIGRLKDLGISAAQIAEATVGVATQRLVRGVCKSCAQTMPITDSEKLIFSKVPKVEAPGFITRGAGCEACGFTGYLGRIPAFEVWTQTRSLGDGIRRGLGNADLEDIAAQNGFEYLFEAGLRLVASGLTTPEEVARVLQEKS